MLLVIQSYRIVFSINSTSQLRHYVAIVSYLPQESRVIPKKLEFEVNNDINSKVSLCQGDITKLNVDAIVNSVNKTKIDGGGIDAGIPEATGPGLVD